MITKKKQLEIEKNRNSRLMRMITAEREKVAGYEQMAKVHSAYISILLKKLGATSEENMITITDAEVKESLKVGGARAIKTEDGWGLFCEDINGE